MSAWTGVSGHDQRASEPSAGEPPPSSRERATFASVPGHARMFRRSLLYMKFFAGAWPAEIVQQPVAQLPLVGGAIGQQAVGQSPWGHISMLLNNSTNQAQRCWCA